MGNFSFTEQWKPISGYEGLYEISNKGRVKTLLRKYYAGHGNNQEFEIKEAFLKQVKSKTGGYMVATLTKNAKSKKIKVHRLVAEAFIENPEGKPFVNHIDFDPKNNNLNNLEWCTQSENMLHSSKMNRLNRIGNKNYKSKRILCISTGIMYDGLHECSRQMNIHYQNINKVCRGVRNYAGGHTFKFV